MTRQIKTTVSLKHKGRKRYLAKKDECQLGGHHEPIPGVLYRRCAKCGNIYVVRDDEYIKRRGETPHDTTHYFSLTDNTEKDEI
jgi:hypothetical protein